MKILDLITQSAGENDLEFVLIGGHAINALGDRRQTRDVDILVCEKDKQVWKQILLSMDYELFNDSAAFMQFNPGQIEEWPLDILLVNEETFRELKANASSINIGGEEDILIPSNNHLIAMKLHTLKQGDEIRRLKDLLDIVTLLRHGNIDIKSEEFKNMCQEFASDEVYEEIINLYEK
jgi:predicted nucleotidyltransferase